jgi:hypothetical protein
MGDGGRTGLYCTVLYILYLTLAVSKEFNMRVRMPVERSVGCLVSVTSSFSHETVVDAVRVGPRLPAMPDRWVAIYSTTTSLQCTPEDAPRRATSTWTAAGKERRAEQSRAEQSVGRRVDDRSTIHIPTLGSWGIESSGVRTQEVEAATSTRFLCPKRERSDQPTFRETL